MGKNITAALALIVTAAIVGAREWIYDLWKQSNIAEKVIWPVLISFVVIGALCWAFYPIVWEWCAYLGI